MFSAILAVAALVTIAVTAIWALVHFVGLQGSLIWTAIVGGLAWTIKASIEQQRERRRLLADQKRAQYLEFLNFMNETFGIAGDKGKLEALTSDPDRIRKLRGWSLTLTMTGSDSVVKAWNAVRVFDYSTAEEGGTNFEMMRAWGRLWLEMRKDCGHHDTSLTITDVLASMLNDAESYRHLLDEPTTKARKGS